MVQAIVVQGINEGPLDVFLADQILEDAWTPFSG
jgi:hypothetical protein